MSAETFVLTLVGIILSLLGALYASIRSDVKESKTEIQKNAVIISDLSVKVGVTNALMIEHEKSTTRLADQMHLMIEDNGKTLRENSTNSHNTINKFLETVADVLKQNTKLLIEKENSWKTG